MICKIIASGSKGNASVLNNHILIDCGVPFRMLGEDYKALNLVLLTHIHGDHFNPNTIKQLHFLRPTLRFVCGPWLVEPMSMLGISPRVVDWIDDETGICYSPGFSVEADYVPHDVPNCAWKISDGGESAFYATDCASLDGVKARSYDLYLIEANYGEEEIRQRERRKIAAGEFSYEARAEATHLSREQADFWLAENATPGKSKVIYLHKHAFDRQTRSPEPSY